MRVSSGVRARLTSCRTCRTASRQRSGRCRAGVVGSECWTAGHQGEHLRLSTQPVACVVALTAPNT
eukprot:scaffold23424_cov75-Phaeocystis_antarctica.AAC.2